MRNIDQIKELKEKLRKKEAEAAELSQKVKDQAIRIKGLQNQNEGLNDLKKRYFDKSNELKRAVLEIQAACNSVVIALLIGNGEETENGTYSMKFSMDDAKKVNEYVIRSAVDIENPTIKSIMAVPSQVVIEQEAESGTDEE